MVIPNSGELTRVETLASLNQPEIGANIERSAIATATGGGLIPALIDLAVENSRSKKAENIISPVRDALVGFDATALLQTELDAALLASQTLPIRSVLVTPPLSPKELKARAESMSADAVLTISVDHRFSPDFGRIDVEATVTLLPLTPILKQRADEASTRYNQPLYHNVLLTGRWLAGAHPKDKAANVALWAADQGAPARNAITSCFTELAAMIAFDLGQGTTAGRPPKAEWDQSAPAPIGPGAAGRILMRGKAVHTTQDRIWVRISTGELSSISR